MFGSSITLFLFLILIFSSKHYKLQFSNSRLFIYLFISILISSFFSFVYDDISHPGLFYILKICSQYLYWICVALFFKKYFRNFNILEVCKYISLGLLCLIFSFFIFSFKLDLSIISIDTNFQRNNFVFIILATFPFTYYYVINNIGLNKHSKLLIFFFFLVMFFSEGRSGLLIFIIELICISIIMNPKIKRLYRFFLGFLIIISFAGNTIFNTIESLSYIVEPYNPRIAGFMRQDGESNVEQDKSLMIRLMMFEKTKEIFDSYPVFGIGPNMFKYYNAPLNFRNEYDRLDYRDDKYINTRSSHGTYFQIISEFGIIGSLFFLILILSPLLYFMKKLIKNKSEKSDLFLVGLLGIAIHFISVSALTGTISWFVFGVAWNIQKNRQLQ